MHHNIAIRWQGHCECPCHHGFPDRCHCAAPAFLQLQVKRKSRKPRKVNLESRVKPFNRTGSKSAYHSHIIAVSKVHKVHALRYLG